MVRTRTAGIVSVIFSVWYLSWLFQVLNTQQPLVAIPFAAANTLLVLLRLVAVVNTWRMSIPQVDLIESNEPWVAVVIPTVREDIQIVEDTVRSVLEQNYPLSKILVIISDDGRRGSTMALADRLQLEYPQSIVICNHPAKHQNYKAGNLNSALALIESEYPEIQLIETRDADDLIGDHNFLRHMVSLLLQDETVAFVQSSKEYLTSKGDPFGNQERTFYWANLIYRNAANAVFPCGSGVVYRKSAINDIGGFDTTGPVEDLRSGYKFLRNGWKGLYTPIVGAYSYYPPEDVGVVVKQRGTWAIDTQSLLFWQSPIFARGLSLAQRLHFVELNMFYWFSLAVMIFIVTLLEALVFRVYPLVSNHFDYAVHFWPFMLALELHMALVNKWIPLEDQWRSRQLWISMSPVFLMSSIRAILNGPRKRPAYQVTRKTGEYKIYWRESALQWAFTLVLIGAVIFHIKKESLFFSADLGSIVWAGYFVMALLPITLGSFRKVGIKQMAAMVRVQSGVVVKWATLPRFAFMTVILVAVAAVSFTALFSFGNIGEARGIMSPVEAQITRVVEATQIPQNITTTLGVYDPNSPYDDYANINLFEQNTGLPIKYILWFSAMGNDDAGFNAGWVAAAAERGLTPVITVEPWRRDFDNRKVAQPRYSFQSIVDGNHDEYFKTWADQARDSGVSIIYRFAQEQSTDLDKFLWYPWQGDPEGFKAAFRHIVELFRAERAYNVQFIWSGMWIDNDRAWLYYPGDDYVDVIGTTVLNHGTAVPSNPWRSFDDLYRLQYDKVVQMTTKPIMITELGTAEQGGNKGQWLAEMVRLLAEDFPQTEAVLLLETKVDREWPAVNWSVTSTPETLAAFQEAWNKYFGSPLVATKR